MKQKRHFKMWSLLLLIFVMAAVFAACGGGEESTKTPQTPSVVEAGPEVPAASSEEEPAQADAIPEGVYPIYTVEDFLAYKAAIEEVMEQTYEKYGVYRGGVDGILMSDIDLTEVCAEGAFTPIGTFLDGDKVIGGSFVGCFDGNGHTISGLNLDLENRLYVGLFVTLYETSVVKNLTFENCHIRGEAMIGVLAGELRQGTVSNCTATSTVCAEGTMYVGGLVGIVITLNDPPSLIENCTSEAVILSEDEDCGGIAGYVQEIEEGATLVNCVDHASITIVK